jgi:hypothetical protein
MLSLSYDFYMLHSSLVIYCQMVKDFILFCCVMQEKGLTKEVAMLEKQKKMLEKLPGMDLNDEIKKLRQACFKANYKNRKLIALCP